MISKIQADQIVSQKGHQLSPTCERWLGLLDCAARSKKDRFDKYAEESAKFFDGNHNWMWEEKYAVDSDTGGYLNDLGEAGIGAFPRFRMSVNRAFEAVALFGPALYSQNPNILVGCHQEPEITPESLGITPDNPYGDQIYGGLMMEQRTRKEKMRTHGSIMQTYLNWLQLEDDKKQQARYAIDEAIIKGCSCLWTSMFTAPGSQIQYPRTTFCSIDDIQIDPDARYWEDVQWIARKCVHPVNMVEEKYGLPPGTLRGQVRSQTAQQDDRKGKPSEQRRSDQLGLSGESFDLIEYWEIYSKNGFGNRLRRRSKQASVSDRDNFDFEPFGNFVKIVVSRGVPFPLNLPTWDIYTKEFDELQEQVNWETPYWSDPNSDGGWPMTRVFFYTNPNNIWPISLFKPCIGEMRFINWCMSFLADKVADSCTTYIGVLKEAAGELRKQLQSGNSPYKILEFSGVTGNTRLNQICDFLQAPPFQADIWKMLSEVMDLIDKRTGLTELVYGMTGRQIRSAREADVKEAATNIRPDDMASKVEDALSAVAAKEMQAARWNCNREDVQHVLGGPGTHIWEQQIITDDYDNLVRDYWFRVEAGSARKPNKAARVDKLVQLGNLVIPIYQELLMGGNPAPFNAYISDYCRALDINPEPYLVQMPQQQEQGPSEEEVAAQIELQQAQQQMALRELDHSQQLEHEEEIHDLSMSQALEKGELEIDLARRKAKASMALKNNRKAATA